MRVFDLYVNAMENSMVQLAMYVANDTAIRDLVQKGFLAARDGNAEEAALYRDMLYETVIGNWRPLQESFHVRQMHFHMGPGDTSFLRVHKPEKFGDDLSSIRHTIVDAITHNQVTYGFESGRVYAGLRGVVPLEEDGKAIGAVETGTSFRSILQELQIETGDDFAVLMDAAYVRETVWKDQVARVFGTTDPRGGYFVEASTDSLINAILNQAADQLSAPSTEVSLFLLEIGDNWYSVRSKPLLDYRTKRDGELRGIGRVVSWTNVTEAVARQDRIFWANLFIATAGYLLVELLLYLGFHFGTRSLHRHIEEQKASLTFANDRLRRFNHLVSHDLKTPFAGIVSLTEVLQQDLPPEEKPLPASKVTEVKSIASTIQSVADDALTLIDELLQSSEDENETYSTTPVAITDLLQSVRKQLKLRLINQNGRIFEKNTHLKIVVEPTEFVQVLVNLIDNSLKYASPDRDPEILIEASTTNQSILIRIQDNGIGIPENQLRKIFTKRQRVTESSANQGHGFGLFIARNIVRENLGDIRATSTLGAGTTMEITLPRFLFNPNS